MGAKEVMTALSSRVSQERNGSFLGMVLGLSHKDFHFTSEAPPVLVVMVVPQALRLVGPQGFFRMQLGNVRRPLESPLACTFHRPPTFTVCK